MRFHGGGLKTLERDEQVDALSRGGLKCKESDGGIVDGEADCDVMGFEEAHEARN